MPRITHEMIDNRQRVAVHERAQGVPLGHQQDARGRASRCWPQRRDRRRHRLLVPHQANRRINEFVAQKLNIPPEKVIHNIEKYGNTTAASIPLALSEAIGEGRVKEGDLVLFAAFGAGFTWGAGSSASERQFTCSQSVSLAPCTGPQTWFSPTGVPTPRLTQRPCTHAALRGATALHIAEVVHASPGRSRGRQVPGQA
jgi:hypothetical protein